MRTTKSSILCLISNLQKELNEHEVWGRGEQGGARAWLFPQIPSKRLSKDCIVYAALTAGPEEGLSYRISPVASWQGAGLCGGWVRAWLNCRRSQDRHMKSEAGSKCPVLPMSSVCSTVSAVLQTGLTGALLLAEPS